MPQGEIIIFDLHSWIQDLSIRSCDCEGFFDVAARFLRQIEIQMNAAEFCPLTQRRPVQQLEDHGDRFAAIPLRGLSENHEILLETRCLLNCLVN